MWPEHLIINILNSFIPRPSVRGSRQGLHLGRAQRIDGRREEVYLSDQRRTEHICVVGKTGSGKTNFLEYLAVQHIENSEGFIFFDFHGDATTQLMQAAAANPAADERLVLVDLSDPTRSPGINPLEPVPGSSSVASNSSELATILRQRWQVDSFGARTEELLRNTLHVLADTGHKQLRVVKFTDYTAEKVRNMWPSAAELRSKWSQAEERSAVIEALERRGISFDELAESAQQPDADTTAASFPLAL